MEGKASRTATRAGSKVRSDRGTAEPQQRTFRVSVKGCRRGGSCARAPC
jgi:hypothetical protein